MSEEETKPNDKEEEGRITDKNSFVFIVCYVCLYKLKLKTSKTSNIILKNLKIFDMTCGTRNFKKSCLQIQPGNVTNKLNIWKISADTNSLSY